MGLIDKDETIRLLRTRLYEKAQIHLECREWGTALIYTECADNRIKAWINEVPTIDAIEVVRCKDCKWHEYEEIGMVWCPNMVGSLVGEDGYCSWGERKDEVKDGE